MNPNYSSRQRKIFNDYKEWSSEKLSEIINNRDKYNPDIIGVIADILRERNVPVPSLQNETEFQKARPISEKEYIQNEKKRVEKESTLRKYITGLREGPAEEVTGIITRYSNYQAEKIEAALTVAVDRGIISYDLRQSLQKQMNDNMTRHYNRKSRYDWESDNAFMEYVSRYNDDEIYEIIDNPNEMVLDVYHAVILTALNRELISDDDFKAFFKGAKSALITDQERMIDDFRERFDLPEEDEEVLDDETVKAEAARHRKCPSCGELVEMEFSVCWNCEAEIPETAVIPDVVEMRREMVPDQTGFKFISALTGFLIMIIFFGGSLLRDWWRHGDPFHHKYITIGFGIFLVGTFIVYLSKINRISKD